MRHENPVEVNRNGQLSSEDNKAKQEKEQDDCNPNKSVNFSQAFVAMASFASQRTELLTVHWGGTQITGKA